MEKKSKSLPGITFTGDITVNGPMFDIHDNKNVHIGKPVEESVKNVVGAPKAVAKERNEERFPFIHPEIEDDEAWHIHDAIKRLVANYSIPEICNYLKEQKRKLLLPSNPSAMYNELVRLGMPNGKGFSEKNFSNSYIK